MDFNLSDVQRAWMQKAEALAKELTGESASADVVLGAARFGVVDPRADLVAAAVAVEALGAEYAAAAIALALHTGVLLALGPDDRFTALSRGETVGAIALSTEDLPVEDGGRLTGRASLVGPLTDHGLAIVGARHGDTLLACAVALDSQEISVRIVGTAALRGFVCGHVMLNGVPAIPVGAPVPFMTRVRILLAAAGLGMGRRALRDALAAAHGYRGRGAGGEQTVQGLLADAATELDAATMLTWKAASAPELSLADASMAKLAATELAKKCALEGMQSMGGYGYATEYPMEQYLRAAVVTTIFGGTSEIQKNIIAKTLGL